MQLRLDISKEKHLNCNHFERNRGTEVKIPRRKLYFRTASNWPKSRSYVFFLILLAIIFLPWNVFIAMFASFLSHQMWISGQGFKLGEALSSMPHNCGRILLVPAQRAWARPDALAPDPSLARTDTRVGSGDGTKHLPSACHTRPGRIPDSQPQLSPIPLGACRAWIWTEVLSHSVHQTYKYTNTYFFLIQGLKIFHFKKIEI